MIFLIGVVTGFVLAIALGAWAEDQGYFDD